MNNKCSSPIINQTGYGQCNKPGEYICNKCDKYKCINCMYNMCYKCHEYIICFHCGFGTINDIIYCDTCKKIIK